MYNKRFVNRLKQNNQKEWSILFDAQYDNLIKFIYVRTLNKELAEDISSLTWIKVVDKISSFEWNNSYGLKAWIYRIAINELNRYFKSNSKFSNEDLENYENVGSSDMQNKIIQNLTVESYLSKIHPNKRIVIELIYGQDMTYEQASEILGISQTSLRQTASRTLKELNILYSNETMEDTNE